MDTSVKIPYTYIIIAALAIVLFFSIKGCQTNKTSFNTLSDYDKQKDDTVMTLKAKNGDLIKYVGQIQVDQQSFKSAIIENEALKNELDNMKVKLSSVKQVDQIIDHISPPLRDTIKVPFYIDTTKHVTAKAKSDTSRFSSAEKFYTLIGFTTSKTIQFTKIDFPDTITTVSENIGNIFKDCYVLKIGHSNPYVNTTGIQSLTIVPVKKWYQTTAFKVAAGFVIGVYIEKKLGL